MINLPRRKKILEILEQEGEINTTELSDRLGVTGATVRSDIRDLEHEGAIVRFHGGIRLPHREESNAGENYMIRSIANVDLKNAIGAEAARLVGDGDTIFMDASSTTFHMIPYLSKTSDVTVITNGLHTAMELQRYDCFKSILVLGGSLRPHSGAIEGISSREMIKRLTGEFYFVSGNGFSYQSGLTGNNFFELELKRMCAERVKNIVAMVDSSKMGIDSTSNFINTSKINCLITDSGINDSGEKLATVEKCRKSGIKVIVADLAGVKKAK